ncbi:membrane protein [Streptomyces sp. AS58]|nr:membrane protein [Streptomyces sp. AS58]
MDQRDGQSGLHQQDGRDLPLASLAPVLPLAPPVPPIPPSPPPTGHPTEHPLGPPAEPRTGVAALSLRYRIGVALALAVVAVAVSVHTGMVFLHIAPSNTVSKKHNEAIENWVYPEFEQNWKLFAPNPLQQNVAVQVRAEISTAGGEIRTSRWYDLSAQDGRAIDGNLLPSHTQQNQLRRAWDFYAATHDSANRPSGLRGALSEKYLRRLVEQRLDRVDVAGPGDVVDRVQVRSRTSNVRPPEWSDEQIPLKPSYRALPWWSVTRDEAGEGAP